VARKRTFGIGAIGQNWTLAYQSSQNAEKEGPQQIALKTHVPAKGSSRVLYVVVYTW